MPDVLKHLVFLLFAAGFATVGWFMAHNPERTYRFFTFGIQPEQKFFVGFCRVVGWVFTVVFAVGVLMYLVYIAYDLLR